MLAGQASVPPCPSGALIVHPVGGQARLSVPVGPLHCCWRSQPCGDALAAEGWRRQSQA